MLSCKIRKEVRFDPNLKIYDYDSVEEASDLVLMPDGEGSGLGDEDDYDEIVELRNSISAADVFTEEFDSPISISGLLAGQANSIGSKSHARDRRRFFHAVLNPVENLSQWRAVKAKGAPVTITGKENYVSNQETHVLRLSEPTVNELSSNFKQKADKPKNSNQKTPRESSSRSPDEISVIGTDGTSRKHTVPAKTSGSISLYKGMQNTASKYREDKREKTMEEMKPIGYNPFARDRSVSHNPLLMPVENLSQWKAIKAKEAVVLSPERKNFASNQEPGASFSSGPSVKEILFSVKSKKIRPRS